MNIARELTLTISKGEQLFMDQLMENQLDIPKTEYRFLKKRRFRFDFAWPDRMIAVEVEGGVWMKGGGGHTTGKGYTRDLEKYNLATLHGWEVYRFTTQDVTKEIAIAFMKNIIINKIIMEESYEDISRGLMFTDNLHSSKHEGKNK
tara:strand:- start:254 stop:694 length:441 start_codon:yes stop_codon:yes gene_type:complete